MLTIGIMARFKDKLCEIDSPEHGLLHRKWVQIIKGRPNELCLVRLVEPCGPMKKGEEFYMHADKLELI